MTSSTTQLLEHELAVLSGESTYEVHGCTASEARDVAEATCQELATPIVRERDVLLLRLDEAGIVIAAEILMAIANARASGTAAHGRSTPARQVEQTAYRTVADCMLRATGNASRSHADPVVHPLTGMLRLVLSQDTHTVGTADQDRTLHADALSTYRALWMQYAIYGIGALNALTVELARHQLTPPIADFPEFLVDAASRRLCAAQLDRRPAAFDHRRAFAQQGIPITEVIEDYATGIGGCPADIHHAYQLLLTRALRAILAITLIDLGQ